MIKRCVDRSREILECIDQQVADVQNKQKLAEVQATIDISGLERMPDHPITAEYRVRQSSYTVPAPSLQVCRWRRATSRYIQGR